jgi:hypothetical protein
MMRVGACFSVSGQSWPTAGADRSNNERKKMKATLFSLYDYFRLRQYHHHVRTFAIPATVEAGITAPADIRFRGYFLFHRSNIVS